MCNSRVSNTIFLFKQGEAFVPESIVRFGKRTEGRDGVVTIMAEDDRIKYIYFVVPYHHSALLSTYNLRKTCTL